MERAGVQAGEEPLDDELGAQVEPGDLADDFGPQVLFGGHEVMLAIGEVGQSVVCVVRVRSEISRFRLQ